MQLLGFFILLVDLFSLFLHGASAFRPAFGPVHTSRQKRLSVLSIVYRKANHTTETPNHLPHSPSSIDRPSTMSPTTATPPPPSSRLTIAPSELTSTIAKLRTTRAPFSSRAPPAAPIEPHLAFSPGDHARLYPLTPKLIEGGAAIPAAFLPYFPNTDKVTLTFLPGNPKDAGIGVASPGTKDPVPRTPFGSPEAPREVAPPANGFPRPPPETPGTSKDRGARPSFDREVAPPADSFPRTPEIPPTSTAPSLQARLHVNTERKHKVVVTTTTTMAPAEWSPLGPALNQVVTGIPANHSCNGRIGYFADPGAACDLFLYCDQFGRSFRFLCPQGTQFNSRLCLCDMHSRCGSRTGTVNNFAQMHSAPSMSDPCPPLT
ncbi:proteoglycan 4-like [Paramacrobiotus metropolitanus]|uniref:proteoglycan 4-like n=1 Tax=Paramacrobiotus metropolitanus TaxID=2943436 RepID=UPI0024460750|nr:proteoglycan 4-like [Paramacrobiotus metropolitanus]